MLAVRCDRDHGEYDANDADREADLLRERIGIVPVPVMDLYLGHAMLPATLAVASD